MRASREMLAAIEALIDAMSVTIRHAEPDDYDRIISQRRRLVGRPSDG